MTGFADLEKEVEFKNKSLNEIIADKESRKLKAIAHYKRSFDAAKFTNLNSSWSTVDSSPSMELFNDLNALRVRARNLYCNSPVVNNFVSLLQQNVIGHKGFTFKSKVLKNNGSINNKIARQIEEAWADFCSSGNFEVTGQLSLVDALDLMAQSLGIDGEIVIRKVYNSGKYGFQIQLLHAEQLIITRHEDYEMGIKRDGYGKPISYCITERHPGDGFLKYNYEPASRIIHAYIPYQIGAPRGIPMISASMSSIRMLDQYQEAELVSARIEASKHIVYTQQQPDDLDTEVAMESVIPAGAKRNTVLPGQAEVLGPGMDAKFLKPEHPNQAFDSFTRNLKKGISSGLGLSYNSLYSDFENTSFSSMRAAFTTERAFYRKIQALFIDKVLKQIFESWIDYACASGTLNLPAVMNSYDYYKSCDFVGKAYEFVDPLKEAEAQKLLLDERLISRTEICAERGVAYSDVLANILSEQELEKEVGLRLELLPKGTSVMAIPNDVNITNPSQPQNTNPIAQ